MSQLTDRLRYVNRVVGGFMVVILVLIVVGLILWIRRSEVFAISVTVPARILAKERDGIRVGTEVYFHGEKVGEVARIEPEASQETQLLQLRLKHAVQEVLDRDPAPDRAEYSRFTVTLRHRLGGVGEPYLDILPAGPADQSQVEQDATVLRVRPEPTTAGEVAGNIEKAEGHLGKASASFSDIQKDFRQVREAIEALQRSLHENVTQTRQEIELIRRNTDALRVSAAVNFEKLGEGSQKLGDSGVKMETEFKQTNEELRAALKKLVAESEKVGQGAEALGTNSQSMAEDFKKASEQLQQTMKSLEVEFAKVGQGAMALETSSKSMAEEFRAASTQLQTSLSTLEVEFAKVGNGAESVQKSTQEMEKQFAKTSEELRKTMDSVEKEFERFGQGSETLGKSSQAIEKQFAETNARMQEVLADLQKASPGLEPLIAQTRRVMDNMLEITRVVNQEAKDLPGTVRKTQMTLDQTQNLIRTIEQNPLIQAGSQKPVSTPLVSPSRVGP